MGLVETNKNRMVSLAHLAYFSKDTIFHLICGPLTVLVALIRSKNSKSGPK